MSHRRIVSDVWDLLRSSRPAFEDFAQGLPQQCLVLIVAGSPCQQLSRAGRHAGAQGLCGPASVLFFSALVVAWTLRRLRPDATVHAIVENAASSLPLHREAILEALGGLCRSEHLLTLDTIYWALTPSTQARVWRSAGGILDSRYGGTGLPRP